MLKAFQDDQVIEVESLCRRLGSVIDDPLQILSQYRHRSKASSNNHQQGRQ